MGGEGLRALLELRKYPEIHTQKDNREFCKFLRGILDEHSPVIPWISLGLSLSSHHLVPEQLDAFMRRMLVSRISRRVLAEHHLALTDGLAQGDTSPQRAQVGIIHTALDVKASVLRCVSLLQERPQGADADFETLHDIHPTNPPTKSDWRWPEVILDGDLDTKFAYIKEHFEYIVFELLKNAMRHTVLRNAGMGELAPIRATIVAGPDIMNVRISDRGGGLRSSSNQTAHDMFSFSHVRNATRLHDERLGALRDLSSSGRGLRATVDEQVARWNEGGSLDLTTSAPTKTLLAHFGKQAAANVEPEPEPVPEIAAKPPSRPAYNARIVSRTPSFPEGSTTPLTRKRRRAESDSPPATPARLRSRSPLVLPSSSPPQQRSSSPLVLSSSPPPRPSGPPSRASSPPPCHIIVPSSSSPMVQRRSPTIIIDDESPLSSPPSPPLTQDERTDSDGLGLTTHPFFAKARSKAKPKEKTAPTKAKGKKPTGSQEVPIEIGGEDEQPKSAVHAFFKPRKAAAATSEAQGSKEKFKGGVDPPWPTPDSIHAGRSTELIVDKPCPVPRRRIVLSETSVSDEATRAWAEMYRRSGVEDDLLDLSTRQIDAWAGLRHPRDDGEGIPEEYANDPAIARFSDPARAFDPPMRSEEILGNGTEVGLIKEWLNKLALKSKQDQEREIREAIEAQQKDDKKEEQGQETGKKRKRKDKKEKAPVVIKRDTIVRTVAKHKKRAKENQNEYDPGMIDDDSLDDGDDFIDDGDEVPVQFEYSLLGNTLVVCGGVGSGKSAAIHACAQELGWTVFEIYPGIGKRGIGANGLAGWVGDAGMNHLVNAKANKEEISQSLILLDHVDMWFEQDTQYWSAIQNLVGESRRGIIITTNDMYAFADMLPVHRYHELDHVEPDLASSYLYAQARAALLHQAGETEAEADVLGRLPSRQTFRELYLKTALAPRLPSYAIQDIPMHPHPSQMDRLRDLGRALEEAKFWVVHGRNCQEREEKEPLDVREAWDGCGYDVVESLGDWSQPKVVRQSGKAEPVDAMRLGRFADTLSWVDAHLERRWSRQLEAAEIDRYEPGPDDQVYYKVVELCKPYNQESFGIAEYCADADIALAALCLARRRLERGGAGGSARFGLKNATHWNARWLEEERSEYQDRVLTYLEKYILSEATPQLPRPAVVLDVLPVVHRIVEADNEFEKEAEKGPARVERGRPRRAAAHAQKQKYVRYLMLHTPDKLGKVLGLVKETEYKLMGQQIAEKRGDMELHAAGTWAEWMVWYLGRNMVIVSAFPPRVMATDERGSATPARTPTPSTDKPRLTSLEYLQLTQRSGRGSITDPSLHVSHPPASPKRPASSLRMRSPGAMSMSLRMIQQVNELTLAGSKRREHDEDEAADSPGPGPRPSQALDFNYGMRRHSIAAVPRMRHSRDLSPLTRSPEHTVPFLPPPAVSGQKRKHNDRTFPAPLEPSDPRFPGTMAPPPGIDQGPMLKRRGSAFDPRMPNIYERRDSIGAAPWLADRRDSTASLYSNTSIASSVGYTTANSSTYSPETQLHNGNKPGQVYAWPDANTTPSQDLPQRTFPSFSETHSNGTAQNFVGGNTDRSTMHPVAVPSLPTNGDRRASGSSGSDAPSRRRSEGTTPEATSQPTVPSSEANASATSSGAGPRRDSVSGSTKETPYSRSPELRVSHKLAERKRRKEMKDLFDELRDHLPADRGMKASKWEILSKAVDYIGQLKQSYAEVSQELDMARHELEAIRPGSITGHHHPAAPHHPHPHPGYALPYGAYPVSNHYPVQPGGGLPPPPAGGPQPPPT
ncbi:unnamed protein product [Rhizoctonia solani]|uniref:Protein-serine/threonine kinase n=1 Tax=Rhizoctonia solani TaxID=456999 RepID=A0A8H3HJZ4_9AGAM|nr:unnamed protein product [Rhizoctonia solani]